MCVSPVSYTHLYTRDASDAVNCVKNGDYQCSFLINATKISEIKDISLDSSSFDDIQRGYYEALCKILSIDSATTVSYTHLYHC